ncbi:MAG TPA: ABC transporter permease [Pseudogracilibacillus sp.]|nr:ABC transporter permease [Pseudogracilibacillus sp.]
MNKFWTVLGHTYFSKLKAKSFLITTAIAIIVIIGIANADKLVDLFSGDEETEIAVIDETDQLMDPLQQSVNEVEGSFKLKAYDDSVADGKQAVEDETYDGLLVLEWNAEEEPEAIYYQNDATESQEEMIVNQQLQQVKVAIATEQAGVDEKTLQSIYDDVSFERVALDESAKTEEELSEARGIVYVMVFLLYMAILIYGQMIATEVATEKSSRVMEILISSASPVTHMFAKIIGIGLLGLTQILVIIAVGYLLIANKLSEYSEGFFEAFGFSSTSTSIYVYAIIFFILGYFLYATISAMLGSLVSRVEDVQQLILPIVFLVMIAFFIAMFGLSQPDATFITVTSFIPFFSPMIMFLRVGMIDVPIWQVGVSMAILIGTIYLFAVLGARIYRGGVLMYGGSRSLKDIKNALVLSKKEK